MSFYIQVYLKIYFILGVTLNFNLKNFASAIHLNPPPHIAANISEVTI